MGEPQPIGVRIALRSPVEIVGVAARKTAGAALAEQLERATGLALPEGPRLSGRDGACVLGVGPGRWLLMVDGVRPELEPGLARDLDGLASIVLQSDAYRIFRVSGPASRATLAKGLPIDLHPQAFGPGSVAVTMAAHIGVIARSVDDTPTYELAVFRSYERSFLAWLRDSAAEFGAEIAV